MNTKKTVKVEEKSVKPVAAKPLAKPVVKAPVTKPVVAKSAPAAKPAAVKSAVTKAPESAAPKAVVKGVVAAEKTQPKLAKEPKAAKKPKLKVVRDSFTMPQSEYQKIAEIKEICLKAGLQVKKSEVLRAGVIALGAMDEAALKRTLSGLDKIKTGRPNKH